MPPATSPNYRRSEPQADEWQTAMATLLLVAEHDGPTMMAHLAMMRAINQAPTPEGQARQGLRIVR